jgi:hypothetical protein
MPIAAIKPITSWSFSRYSDYRSCPQKFKFKHIDKMKEPPSPAMQRGIDIHKLAEDYVKGTLKTLPAELKLFKNEFAKLRKEKIKLVEEQWTWTKDWGGETTWDDWGGAWLRVKLDVAYVNVTHNALVPIDHKTGKFSEWKLPEYLEQLDLYGLAALKKMPDVDVVSPRLWFLDHGRVYPDPTLDLVRGEHEIEYFRKDEKLLEKKWAMKIKPMFADRTFKPTPSESACRFCHFRKANGGPCKF